MSNIKFKFYKWRASYRRRRRLLFPSPAEVEFVRIFGGKYITVGWFKDRRTGFPLTIITSLGKVLEREFIAREIRVGAMFIDFGADTKWYKKGIDVDGKAWHRDITKEIERDEYIANYGWQLFHIEAASVFREPQLVQRKVLEYLAR